ncbi:DUF4181 domain-containing protein [Siminovitchia terrae]|uniref:DUF4181 domain-containing protein n=1 Tax=Siminovitchia terrae TaxID=1914933 RepID=A0A429X0I3_SIMTE|nr:DUF4181 domain-containing protein [Siminovitchia terrae]
MGGERWTVIWAELAIYCLLIISTLIIEKVIRNKLNLPKRTKYNIKFTKKQRFIEVLIVAIFIIGGFLASTSVDDMGSGRTLNEIPIYLWLSFFILVFWSFRGYMAKKSMKDSKEYMIYFVFAAWFPIMVIIAYHSTNIFLN